MDNTAESESSDFGKEKTLSGGFSRGLIAMPRPAIRRIVKHYPRAPARRRKTRAAGGDFFSRTGSVVKGFFRGAVKQAVGAVVSQVKSLPAPRIGAPPSVRKVLENYGVMPILTMRVCREPINAAIDGFLELITFGGLSRAKKKLGYDDLFHLWMELGLADGSMWILEKNHVIRLEEISPRQSVLTGSKVADCRPIKVIPRGLTLSELFVNGASYRGDAFFIYDSVSANCQDFILSLLLGSGIKGPIEFIKQDTSGLLTKYAERFAKAVTDVAASADVVLYGVGAY